MYQINLNICHIQNNTNLHTLSRFLKWRNNTMHTNTHCGRKTMRGRHKKERTDAKAYYRIQKINVVKFEVRKNEMTITGKITYFKQQIVEKKITFGNTSFSVIKSFTQYIISERNIFSFLFLIICSVYNNIWLKHHQYKLS